MPARRQHRSLAHPAAAPRPVAPGAAPLAPPDLARRQQRFHYVALALLLLLGVYLSILYYEHQPVPNSDFPAFVQAGHDFVRFVNSFDPHCVSRDPDGILGFKVRLPFDLKKISSFKRVPVLGLLQVGLSRLAGGQHPELSAGWLLNALLYPPTILLLYLIARRFLGDYAFWFALLAGLNPWALKLLRDPIVETTLVFFFVLTFYLILCRSRWRWVCAAVAPMVRYEGAVLIFVAFVLDQFEARSWRRRGQALLYAALAALPLALWLAGTFAAAKTPADLSGHYISNYSRGHYVLGRFALYLWDSGVGNLLGRVVAAPPHSPAPGAMVFAPVVLPSKIALAALLLLAAGYAGYRRNWNILALFFVLISYYFAHGLRYGTQERYALPMAWVVLLLGCYGLRAAWDLVQGPGRLPRAAVCGLQLLLVVIAAVWFVHLVGYLPRVRRVSTRSVSVPYVAWGVLALGLIAWVRLLRPRGLAAGLAVSALAVLAVAANQFTLAGTVGNGEKDIEFKLLADWYVKNAQPGERLVTTMSHVVGLFAPAAERYFLGPNAVGGQTPEEFSRRCYRAGVAYVAWDSRIGNTPGSAYYSIWGMARLAMLGAGRDVGPFQYLTTLRSPAAGRFIHLYRVRPLPPDAQVALPVPKSAPAPDTPANRAPADDLNP